MPLFPDRSDPQLAAASEPDRTLADLMSSYWVNFARSGDPNGPDLPLWQAHEVLASERAAVLDADPQAERLPEKARLELLDALWARQQPAQH